ncbi:MAG: YraN family protein [Patescibacteria group bacterium]|nr:YraN family protein [Patescibacteria group bacterium]MDD5490786.1 YraN family protein [Patescibacteria group bacterium]
MSNKDLGNWGEDLAVKFLEEKKYKILARNYRNRWGEIDIIASKRDGFFGKEKIFFVEVKTRASNNYGWPEEAVNEEKRKKIEYLADCYLKENNLEGEFRFDVISILRIGNNTEIKHLEDI